MHLKFFQFVQITLDFLSKHQDALHWQPAQCLSVLPRKSLRSQITQPLQNKYVFSLIENGKENSLATRDTLSWHEK